MRSPPMVTEPLLACCSDLNCSSLAASGFAVSDLLAAASSLVWARAARGGRAESVAIKATIHKMSGRIWRISVDRLHWNFLSISGDAESTPGLGRMQTCRRVEDTAESCSLNL